MYSYLKTSVAVGMASLAISSAVNAQNLLNDQRAFYEQLGTAYNLSIDGKLEAAEKSYDGILSDSKASDALKKSAAEGKGYTMALQTKTGLADATSAARKFAFRKKSRETTSWLAKAAKDFDSETLRIQLAQVTAMIAGDDPDYSKLAMSKEYDRLEKTPEGFVSKIAKTEKATAPEPAVKAEPKAEIQTAAKTPEQKPSVQQVVSVSKIAKTNYFAKTNTNIRSGPGTDNSVVGRVFKGQKVVIQERHKVGTSSTSWLKISGVDQFVASSNFTTTNPTVAAKKPVAAPKPAVVKPKPQVTPPKPTPPKPAPASSSACNKNSSGPRFKTVGQTKVYRNTSGSLRFTWGPGVSVKTIVGAQAGYWVVRLGSPSPSVKCGYIKQNDPSLKRVN